MTTTSRPTPDPEVEALNSVIAALADLNENQRRNVLLYVNARYGSKPTMQRAAAGRTSTEPRTDEGVEAGAQFASIGDLFETARPQSAADRVLVVAYWKQVVEGAENFEAFPVSKELKNLGHGVANITRWLDVLIKSSPTLVIQIAKSGKSQQARKRYKVTREGIRRVEALVNGESS